MSRPSVSTIIVAVSLALNVVQANRLQSYRTYVATMKGEHRLKVGDRIPRISGETLSHELRELALDDGRPMTAVYIFTPPCGWCKRNVDNINAIAGTRTGVRLVGLSLTDKGLDAY